jgi:hypothetical protein
MNRSLLLVLAGVVAVVVLFVVFRSGGSDSSSSTTAPTTTATATSTTRTATTTKTTTTKPVAAITVIPITVKQARPVGGIVHAQVKQGQRVSLVVTSPDTTDEVHLHGYDLHSDIENGQARIAFKATIAGRFEAELEQHGVQILDLEVQP